MITPIDKAIVAFLLPLLVWLNQKYGFSFPIDAASLTLLVGAVTGLVVYLVPNKGATS